MDHHWYWIYSIIVTLAMIFFHLGVLLAQYLFGLSPRMCIGLMLSGMMAAAGLAAMLASLRLTSSPSIRAVVLLMLLTLTGIAIDEAWAEVATWPLRERTGLKWEHAAQWASG